MIQLKNVTKKFNHRGIAGLHQISCDFLPSEVIGLIGSNGSGKTTLLNLLAQNILPDVGEISHQGRIHYYSSDLTQKDLSSRVIDFLIREVSESIVDEEKRLQIVRDYADVLEFTSQLYQKTSELSSGQKQKVLLTRAFLKKPDFLLLDEAFSHLDPQSKNEIFKLLFPLFKREQISLIWIHHDLEEVIKYSDKIILLNFGRIEQFESTETLLNAPRNIHVARYLKFENFIHIKKIKNHLWETPWGERELSSFEKNEAYLVIPNSAWEISESGIEMSLEFSHLKHDQQVYKVYYQELPLTFSRSLKLPRLSGSVKLIPRFEECFLIPI